MGEAERRWLDAGRGGLAMEEDGGGVRVKMNVEEEGYQILEVEEVGRMPSFSTYTVS